MAEYFILVNEAGVYTKVGDFFREQGGIEQEWGKKWEKIEAESLHEARQIGIKLRRERYPGVHVTIDEQLW